MAGGTKSYLVLLGDVVASREVADRERFRAVLEAACARVNGEWSVDLIAGFTMLKGVDELGGVLRTPRAVFSMVSAFEEAARPRRIRWVLAGGGIDTAVESGEVARMDGPAFHAAAAGMAALKRSKLQFAATGGDPLLDRALGGLVSAALLFRGTRTESQQRAIEEYARAGSQATAAARLGVSQQAVSEALIRSGYTRMAEVEAIIHEVFALYADHVGERAGGKA
jgi:hypothetical protein